jgi:hypothetical protein
MSGVIMFFTSGCTSTLECGTFTFSGTVHSGGINITNSFRFNPAACPCNCTTNCFIQMIRIYSLDDRSFEYDHSYQELRADANSWFVDKLFGNMIGDNQTATYVWGYYSMQNNGTFMSSSGDLGLSNSGTPGNNTTPTVLIDDPQRDPSLHAIWEAVDVPVCIDSETCDNRIQGYYYWSWIVDFSGTTHKFIMADAWKDLDSEFQSALSAWNAWAPGVGANVFPPTHDL